jgi:antitoxin component YwqK of YwqJK toxin-antitoxin module
MASEVEFVDGVQHGVARDWYRDGQIHGYTEFSRGVRHGFEQEWFEDGRKAMEALRTRHSH